MSKSCELTFLEACAALDAGKCTKIENEFGTQHMIDKEGCLATCGAPFDGIRRSPGGFLGKWHLVGIKPVKHVEVFEGIKWYMDQDSGVIYPSRFTTFPWKTLITKPSMKMTLSWEE